MNTYYHDATQEYKINRKKDEPKNMFLTRIANEIQTMTDKIVDVTIGEHHVVIYYKIKMNADHTRYTG